MTAAASETNFKTIGAPNMGAGLWPCGRVIEFASQQGASELNHAIGWILGAWSMATTVREPGFIEIVNEVGPREIVKRTLIECQKVPPEIMLFRVVTTMIEKTSPQESTDELGP
ncbi:MAG: 5'-methylthioadenosine phosphorylase [Pseudomonadota bacterium]